MCSARRADEKDLSFDRVLLAVGRDANVEDMGLDALGIAVGPSGKIDEEEYLCTCDAHYLGVRRRSWSLPVYPYGQSPGLVRRGERPVGRFRRFRVDYSVVPWATFTDPEVARVGLIEDEARSRNIACDVSRYDLARPGPSDRRRRSTRIHQGADRAGP